MGLKTRRIHREAEMVDRPAILREDHIRDRPLAPTAGAPKGWRRRDPLEIAFERGQLGGGDPRYTAMRRREAGEFYAELFAAAQTSGRDSTELRPIGARSTRGTPLSQSQAEALGELTALERAMGARDAKIVRMVCGEGYFPSEAVRAVCSDYRHSVPARLREALDALIEAIEKRRGPRRG